MEGRLVAAMLNRCHRHGQDQALVEDQGLAGLAIGEDHRRGELPEVEHAPAVWYVNAWKSSSARPSGPRFATLSDLSSSGGGMPVGGGSHGHSHSSDDDDDDDTDGNGDGESWFTGGERRCVRSEIAIQSLC